MKKSGRAFKCCDEIKSEHHVLLRMGHLFHYEYEELMIAYLLIDLIIHVITIDSSI